MTNLKLNFKSDEIKKSNLIFELIQVKCDLAELEDSFPHLLADLNKLIDEQRVNIKGFKEENRGLLELDLLKQVLSRNHFLNRIKSNLNRIKNKFDILVSRFSSLEEINNQFLHVKTEFEDYIINLDQGDLDKKFEENIGYVCDRINEILMKVEEV